MKREVDNFAISNGTVKVGYEAGRPQSMTVSSALGIVLISH